MEEIRAQNRQEEILHAISRLSRTMRRVRKDRETIPAGLFYPLCAIEKNPGIIAGKLAVMLDIRPSSLTEALVRAEEKGLIRRTADEKDARVTHLYLTDDGKAEVERRNSLQDLERTALSRALTDAEAEEFCALCEKIRKIFEEEFSL